MAEKESAGTCRDEPVGNRLLAAFADVLQRPCRFPPAILKKPVDYGCAPTYFKIKWLNVCQ
nr:hypothetical protein [uncultured Ralstonia sp.]